MTICDVSSADAINTAFLCFRQKSEAMWAYASYEPKQEIEEAGIHYTLTSLSKDEWMQTDRFKNVTKYQSCLEGQEVLEALDVETADDVQEKLFMEQLEELS